jgi:hypothetical protein
MPDIDQRLMRAEQAGTVSGLHALLVSQRGKLVYACPRIPACR